MKRIKLTQDKCALVDDEDFERINQYNWCAHYDGWNWYAVRSTRRINGKRPIQYMHRFIMNTPKDIDTDHENHNGLDNQKHNLRNCTHAQNHYNQKPHGGTSKYKGIYWDKERKKWKARIGLNNKQMHIGRYANEIAAAKAYDMAAKESFGEFAYLNFGGNQ